MSVAGLLDRLAGVYRAREWFVTKLPLMWVAYWTVPGIGDSIGHWFTFTICAVSALAFGYAVNDLSDAGVDVVAGKIRPLVALDPWLRAAVVALPIGAGYAAAAAFGFPGILGQTAALLIAAGYSLPPTRLKESVRWGPLAASFGQRVAPAACLAGERPGAATIVALALGLLAGLRAIYVHQLLDAESDAALGLTTTTVALGPVRVRRILYGVLIPLEALCTVGLGSLLAATVLGPLAAAVFVALVALAAAVVLAAWGLRSDSMRFRVEHGPVPGWTVQSVLLPAVAAVAAGALLPAVLQLVLVMPRAIARSRALLHGRRLQSVLVGDGECPRPVARRGYVEWWYLHANADGAHLSGSVRLSGNPERPESLRTVVQFALTLDGVCKLCSAETKGLQYASTPGGGLAFQVGEMSARRTVDGERVTWSLTLGKDEPAVTIEGERAVCGTIWIKGDDVTGGLNWTPWLLQASARMVTSDGRLIIGTAYQDHNWSSTPIQECVRSWRWMHVASPVPVLVAEVRLSGLRWPYPVRRRVLPDGLVAGFGRWSRRGLDLGDGVSVSGLGESVRVPTAGRVSWWWERWLPPSLRPGYCRYYGPVRVTGTPATSLSAWHVHEEMRF